MLEHIVNCTKAQRHEPNFDLKSGDGGIEKCVSEHK
jgi:hypothetical protein